MKNIYILLIGCFSLVSSKAQDPHYTQFYAAPFTVNPAYTGVFNGDLRVMTNYRQQWGNLSSPYTTSTVAVDGKVGKRESYGQHPLNIGIQFLNDKSMKGAFRSNYITGTAAYHVKLDEDGYESLGLGLSTTYGNRRIDFSSLSFEQQFTSGGFDLTLPNQEAALQQMQPFFTVGAGLMYVYNNAEQGTFIDAGISGYHFNKPKQTVLNDDNEYLPVRLSAQFTLQQYLREDIMLNLRALYQNQAAVEYLLAGGSINKLFGDAKQYMIGGGIWYRTGDAISPYLIFDYNQMQLGLSYDVTTNALKKGPSVARSFELSLQWIMKHR